jgi:uncharacterized protein YggT (Ycf19 family)
MSIVDWILNVAAVFLWIDWRSGRGARPQSALSIASTIRPADHSRARGLGSLATLFVILLVRPLFYYTIGSAAEWTAATNFLAISIPWRSDLLGLMYIFSTLSFLKSLCFYYSWLFFVSAVHPLPSTPEEEPMSRFIRAQLAWLDKIPRWLKLFVPSLVAALAWILLSFLLVELELLPSAQKPGAVRGQAAAFALGAILTWKWLILFILLVHLLNLYVYLGTHPIWPYLSSIARKLLYPFSFLRIGKIDLSPIVGILALLAFCELFLKPLAIDLFRRNII